MAIIPGTVQTTFIIYKSKKNRQHNGQKKKNRQHNGQKKKNRQHNGQKKINESTNNDPQNILINQRSSKLM